MDLDETRTFPIESSIRDQVLHQLNLDADFLAKHNIMDYSLLVGLVVKSDAKTEEIEEKDKKKRKKKHKKDKETQKSENKTVDLESVWRSGIPSATVPSEHYMVGIIDILQDYNTFKKSAHLLKLIVYRTSVRLILSNPYNFDFILLQMQFNAKNHTLTSRK